MVISTNNKPSQVLETKTPFFIREDHPRFALFLKKYFEFLEQEYAPVGALTEHYKNIDIDQISDDQYLELLYSKFIADLPADIKTDKTTIMKYIKDFYRAKGSEKSVHFLLNALIGESNTAIYYPKRDILRASSGKWQRQKVLEITEPKLDGVPVSIDLALTIFNNRRIEGAVSNTTAIVERSNMIYQFGLEIIELHISNPSGNFQNFETLTTIYTDESGFAHIATANVNGGSVREIFIDAGGQNYEEGTYLIFTGGGGPNPELVNARISQVSAGNVTAILVLDGGVGYTPNDAVIVTAVGTGSGANGRVSLTDTSELYHANTYKLFPDTLNTWGNTTLSNVLTFNLGVVDIANTTVENCINSYILSNVGPALQIVVVNAGDNYDTAPNAVITPNTRLLATGILGKMEIISPGSDYQIGDIITFNNTIAPFGFFGRANVRNVDANGAITQIGWHPFEGIYPGGFGYRQDNLPIGTIDSANGTNGNVIATNILGTGASLRAFNGVTGAIEKITIVHPGRSLDTAPSAFAPGGTGAILRPVIVQGTKDLAGRFLDDTGFLSSSNYLRGPHYYQNYSYEIITEQPYNEWANTFTKLAHPAGMKLFGKLILNSYDLNPKNSHGEFSSILEENLTTFDFINDEALVIDSYNLLNNFNGSANNLLTYTSPSPKWIINNQGKYELGTGLRCDHDPVTGKPLGIPIERIDANYLTYSTKFDSNWNNTTSAKQDRESLFIGEKAQSFTTNAFAQYISKFPIALSNSTPYCINAIIEEETANLFEFGIFNHVNSSWIGLARYNWTTDNIITSQGTTNSIGVIDFGIGPNGGRLKRVWATITTGTEISRGVYFYPTGSPINNNKATIHYAGLSFAGSGFPSSPIKTEGGTVSRNPDNVSISLSNIAFNATSFSVITTASISKSPLGATSHNLFGLGGSNTTNTIVIRNYTTEGLQLVGIANGVNQLVINQVNSTKRVRSASTYQTNNTQMVINGISSGIDNSGIIPTELTNLYIGRNAPGGFGVEWSGHIENLTLIPRFLDTNELIEKTTFTL